VDRPLSLGRGVVKLLWQSANESTAGHDYPICGNNHLTTEIKPASDGALSFSNKKPGGPGTPGFRCQSCDDGATGFRGWHQMFALSRFSATKSC
jgi:hypothetical protein